MTIAFWLEGDDDGDPAEQHEADILPPVGAHVTFGAYTEFEITRIHIDYSYRKIGGTTVTADVWMRPAES